MAARVLIGTSGYVYPHWRQGVFYPPGLPARDELPYYAARFPTVELNNPFYRVPGREALARWREATPPGFLFAVKANREITHLRRLADCATPLATFLALAEELGPKLGPILFQLPPSLPRDQPRLERFLATLPPGHRWTFEFRHPSWHHPDVYEVLARRGAALCIPVGGRAGPDLVTTAPFTYLRMHAGELPGGGFSPAQLRSWAGRVRALRRAAKDVYVYFNNDRGGFAVRDAAALGRLVGGAGEPPDPTPASG